MDPAPRIRRIHHAILADERRLRDRHPWLARQDAIGLGLWLASGLLILTLAWLFLAGKLAWWLAIPALALPLSVLHELEHDLIHHLYFKARPRVQDLMFTGIWLAKGSLDPWARRDLHLRHHRLSGQPGDVEERLIGLGLRSLPLRLLVAILPAAAVVLLPGILRDAPDWQVLHEGLWSPRRWRQRLGVLFLGAPLVVVPLAVVGVAGAWPLLVLWILPNTLRHACIALLSSASHYYGDVQDVTQQNQILRHWALWPMQLFCFDFGATHVIHHYVVQQPFYLRHAVRHAAWRALEAEGTRVNDLHVLARANRYATTEGA